MTERRMDPHEEDVELQEAILHHILDEHPTLLCQADLFREIPSGVEERVHRENVERAIDELARRGLLKNLGDYVLPTRAAMYSRLLGGL